MRQSNLVVLLIAAVAGASILGLFLTRQSTSPAAVNSASSNRSGSEARSEQANTNANTNASTGNPFIDAVSSSAPATTVEENQNFLEAASTIVFRLLIAVGLTAILAFRPRKNFPLFKRNLYVAQTQILLSVVAAALMMIVGDNAARAFAIFAAVSLVRFRTNIRDPKEVTVLLISLALGLAAGVGRWDLGVVLALFSLILLYFLEYNEQEQAYRSMELTVKSRNTEHTMDVLRRLFKKNNLDAEVRQLDPTENGNDIGQIQYYLNLRLSLSTDQLSDKILSLDPNVDAIQWSKTKSATDIYQ
jgi:uncharacterized membrane protein YhiD involved in acid resistance